MSPTTRPSIFSIVTIFLVVPHLAISYKTVVFSIVTIFLVLPHLAISYKTVVFDENPSYRKIELLSAITGPESIAFDPQGGGPYTGVSDGRVLKWMGCGRGWTEFAIPPRHSKDCHGTSNTTMEDKCGRPLGLQFHKATGDLYIADAYFGLLSVGPRGGVATRLATAAEGVPFNFTNGVDVDPRTGIVYFTDSSTRFQRRDWLWCIVTDDATGRFMSYNPRTRQVKVLLRDLQFPNGVALSDDSSFVLIGETTTQRVLRYWLHGPKAGTFNVFANVTNYPDNIKRNPQGEFWVAVNSGRGSSTDGATELLKKHGQSEGEEVEDTVAMRFGEGGMLLEVLNDKREIASLSEVEENNGTLWLGSVVSSFVGVYKSLN